VADGINPSAAIISNLHPPPFYISFDRSSDAGDVGVEAPPARRSFADFRKEVRSGINPPEESHRWMGGCHPPLLYDHPFGVPPPYRSYMGGSYGVPQKIQRPKKYFLSPWGRGVIEGRWYFGKYYHCPGPPVPDDPEAEKGNFF